jgi:predicted CoA-binding protein
MEIRDGLTTGMTYAVVATRRDFGPDSAGGRRGDDAEFWGMLKPRYEAHKIVEVLRGWGATVYPVGDVAEVASLRCAPRLADLPGPADCAVLSLPQPAALALVDEVAAAGIPAVWLQYGARKDLVRQAYLSRGIRVVSGCVLLHWDVDHVSGARKGRHVCFMHGNLNRAARIRVDAQGVAHKIEPVDPGRLPFGRETYGTRLLDPIWPKPQPPVKAGERR